MTLSRTETDLTGRKVNIYRKQTVILTKEEAKQYKEIVDAQKQFEIDHPFHKWEGEAIVPRTVK